MTQCIVRGLSPKPLCFEYDFIHNDIEQLRSDIAALLGIQQASDLRLVSHGKDLVSTNADHILKNCVGGFLPISVSLRIVGGKGGFGANLRGGPTGPQTKKTTNFGSMRDLEGRRLKHVDAQRRVQVFLAKQRGEPIPEEDRKEGRSKKKRRRTNYHKEQQEKLKEEKRVAERDSHFEAPKPDESQLQQSATELVNEVINSVSEGYKKAKQREEEEKKKKEQVVSVWNDGLDELSEDDEEETTPAKESDSTEQKENDVDGNDSAETSGDGADSAESSGDGADSADSIGEGSYRTESTGDSASCDSGKLKEKELDEVREAASPQSTRLTFSFQDKEASPSRQKRKREELSNSSEEDVSASNAKRTKIE